MTQFPARPPVGVPKASDILAGQLRALILGQSMSPGDSLPSESEIMTQYGFSRQTVREALRLLEVDGLIVVRRGPKGGVRVARPDASQVSRSLGTLFAVRQTSLADLFAFRLLLEPEVAAEAARVATAEQREELLEMAAREGAGPTSVSDSAGFHSAIGIASNNGVYEVLLQVVNDGHDWHATHEGLTEEDVRSASRAHLSIARAIAAGDAKAAAQRMTRHLKLGQARLDAPIVPHTRWT